MPFAVCSLQRSFTSIYQDHPKECFLEVFGYIKATKKQPFGVGSRSNCFLHFSDNEETKEKAKLKLATTFRCGQDLSLRILSQKEYKDTIYTMHYV